jgi:hypothetical protein
MNRHPYATPVYAESFGMGHIDVPEWRTSLLVRPIPNTPWSDALGCYPLTALHRDADLAAGLDRLRAAGLVSVALVPDPLTGPSTEALTAAFPVCRPFKTHYLIDREAGPVRFGYSHRNKVQRSYRALTITATDIRRNDSEWIRTYQHTVERHGVTGIANFAPSYFAALGCMTEATVVAAFREERMVAMMVWVRSGDIAYAHIGGASDVGHKFYAMYGIVATATTHFADCRVLHLGGVAGNTDDGDDGLAFFKKGFANRQAAASLCGAVLDEHRYGLLTAGRPQAAFFPEYR